MERRATFFEELETAPDHIPQLRDLIVECLDNDLHRRPSTQQIIITLDAIKTGNAVGNPCSEDIRRAADILKAGEKKRIAAVSFSKHITKNGPCMHAYRKIGRCSGLI